jgi:sugar phosphate isomerase/epimerase
MTEDRIKWVQKKLDDAGIKLVAYGVVAFENTEPAMRLVFDFAKKMGIRVINTEPAYDDWTLLEKMAQEYNVKVAIHNHPNTMASMNRYSYPQTVLEHVKGLDPRIGSGADTGHWMRSGVDPVEALRMLRGRVVHCHLKDLDKFGDKDAKDVPFGSGKADIRGILAELTMQDYDGYLTVEHENEAEVMNPSPSIEKGLGYIDSVTYYKKYRQLLKRWDGRYNLHGWNHYGPGYFLIDGKSGVITGQDGMGLLWFGERTFKDFVLEMDYKCAEVFTNSGVFLRVPEMPVSDDYIYKSFEIQICDSEKGIHATGAVYDAESASTKAFNEPGEWNHYKITFKGKHITVELNGRTVVDWDAEPRGKVKSFAPQGYIGLQNHDSRAPVYFKNIYVKEL